MVLLLPAVILGFHADNGSEYINCKIVKLLETLRIKFTKSRSRHSNDNALAESKDGPVVRKRLWATRISRNTVPAWSMPSVPISLNSYVNFHRQCFFPEMITDAKRKERKRYEEMKMPYEKLKSLP